MRIWGRRSSVNVQKVLWIADELGIAYERIDAGGRFSDLATDAFRALNPNARIPVIEDNGLVLWESNTIVRYLAAAYSHGRLYPPDARQRADAERWMDWQLTEMLPGMKVLFFQLIRATPAEKDPAATEHARIAAESAWRMLDAHLANREFLSGTALSIADIPLGTFAYRWMALPIERPKLPALEAWYGRLCTRPPYVSNVMRPLE